MKIKNLCKSAAALLAVLLAASMFAFCVSAEGTGVLSLGSTTVRAGGTADVTVNLDQNPGIISITIDIAYAEGLELTDIQYQNETGLPLFGENPLVVWYTEMPSDNPNAFAKNPKRLSWGGDTAPTVTTTGVIATLSFKVPADAAPGTEYEITPILADNFIDHELNPVEFELKPATITVVEAPTTTLVPEKSPTCTEPGNIEYYEGSDGKLYLDAEATQETTLEDVTLAPTGHTLTKVEAKDPTATEDGNKEYWQCEVCGELFLDAEGTQPTTLEDVTIKALGELTLVPAKEATCTEPGNTEYYVDAEGNLYADAEGKQPITAEQTVIDPTGHTLVKTDAKAPTCEEAGNIEYYTCSVCGKIYKDEAATTEITAADVVVPAAGHKLVLVPGKEATATENGNIEYYKCSVCGKLFKDAAGEDEITLEETVIKATGEPASREPASPGTGDNAMIIASVVGMVLAAAAIVTVVVVKKKANEND